MLSYGGEVLPEVPAALAGWIASRIPLIRAFSFAERPRLSDRYLDPRFGWLVHRPVHVNTFFNPWGASRWGVGYFLLDDASKVESIREQVYGEDGDEFNALPLIIDDREDSIETDLFMLPLVPLTADDAGGLNASLMVLVDERFFWWEEAAELTVVEETTTWAQLISAIGTALGATIVHDTISADYLYPSVGLSKSYEYLPEILDLVAESIGRRLTRGLDGTITLRTAAAAKALAVAQYEEFATRMAGGPLTLGVIDAD